MIFDQDVSIIVPEAGLPLLVPDDVDAFLALLDALPDVDVVVVDAAEAVVVVDVVFSRINGDDSDDEPRLSSKQIPLPRMLGATMSL